MSAKIFLIGVLVWFFCCLGSVPLQSQSLSMEKFLTSALVEPAYRSYENQSSVFDKPGSYSLPWVQNLEFRTRNNELLDSRQQYALRADIGNPWQISSNQRYFKGLRNAKSLEQQLLLKKLMRERYDLLVEYWYSVERLALLTRIRNIGQQISEAMSRRSGSEDFDAEQYLNRELDLVTKIADLEEAAFERDLAWSKIMELGGRDHSDLDITRFIDVQGIRGVIGRAAVSVDSAAEISLIKQEIANAEQKIRTDRLNFDLGFVQGMYAPYRASRGDGQFGLAAGVTIPLFNQNRDDIARERLRIAERQGALEQVQHRVLGQQQSDVSMVSSHINHFLVIDSLTQAVRTRQMNLPAALSKNYNPLVELRYQEKLVELDVLKLRVRREMLKQYIDFLDHAGRLHQRPLVNYLDAQLRSIEQ